jgi:hypothetical protein
MHFAGYVRENAGSSQSQRFFLTASQKLRGKFERIKQSAALANAAQKPCQSASSAATNHSPQQQTAKQRKRNNGRAKEFSK